MVNLIMMTVEKTRGLSVDSWVMICNLLGENCCKHDLNLSISIKKGQKMISDSDPTQDLSSHYRLPDSALVTLLNFKKRKPTKCGCWPPWSTWTCGTVCGGRLSKRFRNLFSESSTGSWSEQQLPCCPSKQGELPESMLQNLLLNLPPQTVEHKLQQPHC